MPLSGAGDNTASRRAIGVLRNDLVPQTLGGVPGVETAVTGPTAEDVDFTNQMKHGVPYVIVFVLVLAFLLAAVRGGASSSRQLNSRAGSRRARRGRSN